MDMGMLVSENERRSFFFLELSLLGVIFVSPIFFGLVYGWGFFAVSAFLFFLLFCYPQAVFKFKKLSLAFCWPVVALFLWILCQLIWFSMNRYGTHVELVKWLAVACGFLLIQLLPRQSIMHLLILMVILGCLESVYGLWEHYGGKEMVLWQAKKFHRGFVTGTYLNRNHLAGLLELSLGIHLGALLYALRRHKRGLVSLLGLSLLITCIAFLKTGSRSGLFSLTVSLLLFSPFIFGRHWKSAIVLWLVILLIFGLALLPAYRIFLSRVNSFQDDLMNWGEGRLAVWKNTWQIVTEHPWAGIGLGSFEWVFPSYQSERLTRGWAHAHNDYLELLAELGLPAFFVLIFSFLVLWLRIWRRLRISHSPSSAFLWGGLVGITSLSLHGLTDFNFAIPANGMLFVFLFGMLWRLSNYRRSHQVRQVKHHG